MLANSVDVARFLTALRYDPFGPGRFADGATAFWIACRSGHVEMVKVFLSNLKKGDSSLAMQKFEGLDPFEAAAAAATASDQSQDLVK